MRNISLEVVLATAVVGALGWLDAAFGFGCGFECWVASASGPGFSAAQLTVAAVIVKVGAS